MPAKKRVVDANKGKSKNAAEVKKLLETVKVTLEKQMRFEAPKEATHAADAKQQTAAAKTQPSAADAKAEAAAKPRLRRDTLEELWADVAELQGLVSKLTKLQAEMDEEDEQMKHMKPEEKKEKFARYMVCAVCGCGRDLR
jgi:hypothetical protein